LSINCRLFRACIHRRGSSLMFFYNLRTQTVDILPLTRLQQEMYASISLGLCDYKEEIHICFRQTPDCDFLRQALEAVVLGQPALRSVFRQATAKKPAQIVLKDVTLPFYLDCDTPELDIATEPWNLSVCTTQNRLTLRYNHIVMDGWSMAVLFHQLFSGYENLVVGETCSIPIAPTTRVLFSARKNTEKSKNGEFWRDTLSNCQPTLLGDSVYALDEPIGESYRGFLTREITQKFSCKAKKMGYTPAVLFYAGWAALLGSFTGSKKVCLGVLLSGRGSGEISFDTIGMYTQLIPLVTNLEGDFLNICHGISNFLSCPEVNVFEAGDDALLSIGFSRWKELFDTLVAVENYPLDVTKTSWPSLKVDSYDYYERPSYPFTLQIRMGNEIELNLISSEKKLCGSLKGILDCYVDFLHQIADGAAGPSELKIRDVPDEKGLFVPLAGNATLDRLIRDGCIAGGNRIAIIDGEDTLTFFEILEQSERCACGLTALGVTPGEALGVCMERSARQLIAVYAILLAGGVYVPFSDSIPVRRANEMMARAGIRRIICHSLPDDWQAEAVLFDNLLRNHDPTLPVLSEDPNRTAYILFTSGTTGQPKGCMVSHGALYNRLLWNCTYLALMQEQRQLYKTPITFDVSLIEIFSLFVGRFTLYILPQGDENRADCLAEVIAKNRITYLHFVPSMLHGFLDYLDAFGREKCLETIRVMVCSGEILPSSIVKNILRRASCSGMRLYNLYGPTEAAVDVSVHACATDWAKAETPIGRPIWNTELRLLDPWQRSLPNGISGELYILGSNLGQGYINNPDQTANCFVALPDGENAYRTGDIAYRLANGELVVTGRRDDQVKYNGVRIEMSEISGAMLESGLVREAVALVHRGSSDRLIAFYDGDEKTEQHLRRYLTERLPAHMLPSNYCPIITMPKTAHGKLDKTELLKHFDLQGQLTQALCSPNDEIERGIVGIWQSLLKTDRVFLPGDNFFACGGTSLMLIHMQIEIRKRWGVELPAHRIYEFPLLGHICRLVQTVPNGQTAREPVTSPMLNPAQENIAAFQFAHPDSTAYNMPVCFCLLSSVRGGDVLDHISRMIEENPWLRLVVRPVENGFQANTLKYTLPEWEVFSCPSEELQTRISGFVRPFSPEKLMIRGAVLQSGQKEYVLLDLHHLLCDQTVARLLVESLLARMEGEEKPLEMPVYKAALLRNDNETAESFPVTGGKILDRIRAYCPERVGRLELERFSFTAEENQAVYDACAQYGVSAFVVLFSAFFLLSSRIADSENLVIGTNTTTDTLQSVAMSLVVLPIQMQFHSYDTFETILKRLHATFAAALSKGGIHAPEQFDVMFIREESPFRDTSWKKYFHEVSYINTMSKLGLTLFYQETDGVFIFCFHYDAGLFDKQTVRNFVESYRFLLAKGLAEPERHISEFQTMPPEREAMVAAFSRGLETSLPQQTIQSIFLDTCEKNPDAIAIYNEKNWSYREFLESASAVAASLRREDAGDLIGVLLPPSAEYLIAVFGILLAGKAFLPLDTQTPSERNGAILSDSGVTLCLTNENLQFRDICCLTVKELSSCTLSLQRRGNMEDAVYCIYTSGSTGRPKGCVITQSNALNYLQWANSFYLNGERGCFAFFTSPATDMTITSTLLPIMFGHSVVIYPQSAQSILDMSNDVRVTVLKATPSHLRLLREKRISSLRVLIAGGEQFTSALAENLSAIWENPPRIYNEYGPTEATVGCMIYEYNPADSWSAVPIGTAIDNMQVSILDSKGRLCLPGISGELVLHGRSVIAGYLNHLQMTEERFSLRSDAVWQYKTGDYAHMRVDGRILYESRRDNQFQLSGYRVELSEIEQAAKEAEGIEDACAVVRKNQAGNGRLILYCVASCAECRDELRLRKTLFQKLPRYMIPGQIVFLERIPLTSSGKADRAAITEDKGAEARLSGDVVGFLSGCWNRVLGNAKFTPDDGFMEAGGNSLTIVTLQQEIAKQYPQVTIEDLFCYPSVRALAAYLEYGKEERKTRIRGTDDGVVITGAAFSLCGAADFPSLREVFSSRSSQINYPDSKRRKDTKTALSNMGMREELYRFSMASFLSDIDLFDNDYFRIGKDEADAMDPAHKLLFTTSDRAFADAGFGENLRGMKSAVVFATPENIGFQDYVSRCYPNLSQAAMLNRVGSSIAGRIQHFYNLTGPAYLIDCACSSGLAALYHACAMLRNGDCDLALVGGVNLLNPLDIAEKRKADVLSRRHHANTFSAIADGTARGEGCICFVLERKEDAERTNRQIYAEIAGGAMNNDGFSSSVTAPNGSAQVHVIRAAMKNAAVKSSDFGILEAHGTATQLGDSVELQALGNAFSEQTVPGQCALSAAKTVYGHLDSASGLLGVLKSILSLHYRELYPFIAMEVPTERFDFIQSPFYIPDRVMPFPKNQNDDRICGVSSFGLSGTNVHIILRQGNRVPDRAAVTPSRQNPKRCWLPDEPECQMMPDTVRQKTRVQMRQTHDQIAEKLSKKAARLSSAKDITLDLPLYEMGFDSVSVVQLRIFIRSNYGIELPVSPQDTINLIANEIFRKETKDLPELKKRNHANESPQSLESMSLHENWTDYQFRSMVSGFVEDYIKRTHHSRERMLDENLHWANGRFITGQTKGLEELSYPVLASRGSGSEIWDVDGNHYVDFAMGFGVHFFGYNHSKIEGAVAEAMRNGPVLGALMDAPFRVAKQINRLSGVERVSFCSSGTEAMMNLLRLARAATNRMRVVVFEESFHGTFDPLFSMKNELDDDLHPLPRSMGTPVSYMDDIVMLPYGEDSTLEYVRTYGSELAAVLVEPVQSRHPALRPKAFLRTLREITKETGTLLIFDEVITGFRSGAAGTQAYYGVQSDLVAYGKVIGGGYPIGVFGGMARYMDILDHRGSLTAMGDSHTLVGTGGTFHAHPVSMAAAEAVLSMLEESGESLYAKVNAMTEYLAVQLNEFFSQGESGIRIEHFCSQFIFSGGEARILRLLQYLLIHHGIYVWEGGTCFVSAAHTWEQIHAFVDTVKLCVEEMKKLLPKPHPVSVRLTKGFSPKDYARLEQFALQYDLEEIESLDARTTALLANNVAQRMQGDDISTIRLYIRKQIAPDKVQSCINQIIAASRQLRSGLSWRRLEKPIRMVFQKAVCQVNGQEADQGELEPLVRQTIEARKTSGFQLESAPLVGVDVFNENHGGTELLLSFYNAWLDGWSVDLLLRCLFRLLNGEQVELTEVDWRSFKQWEEQNMLYAKSYWETALHHFTPTPHCEFTEGVWEESTLQIESDLAHALTVFAAKHRLSEAAVYLCLMARAMEKSWIMTSVSGRNAPVSGLWNTIGNLASLVPIHVPQAGCTEQAMVVNAAIREISELPACDLGTIQSYAGLNPEALNTLVQSHTVVILNQTQENLTAEASIFEDRSYVRVPCRYYITPGKELFITYHTGHLSCEGAAEIARRFVEQIKRYIMEETS
jgi:amino acid adenylation domain-containing protein